ncbi:sulfurtransferase TusA family protein [Roseibaca calidilacus]|uniref:Uncharacterized protein n=1 Tax=Roseibaca calidilacus TaxID=1666912 RepID=A0ABM9VT09_9RHOB|nr:hypothetical protein [Roseibaca calidilacus]CUX80894.1 hypothetical protein Ga0058931_1402 [Roseibaca calidilacus]
MRHNCAVRAHCQVSLSLRVLGEDPVAGVGLPHVCAGSGHDLLSQSDSDGAQLYVIRQGGC